MQLSIRDSAPWTFAPKEGGVALGSKALKAIQELISEVDVSQLIGSHAETSAISQPGFPHAMFLSLLCQAYDTDALSDVERHVLIKCAVLPLKVGATLAAMPAVSAAGTPMVFVSNVAPIKLKSLLIAQWNLVLDIFFSLTNTGIAGPFWKKIPHSVIESFAYECSVRCTEEKSLLALTTLARFAWQSPELELSVSLVVSGLRRAFHILNSKCSVTTILDSLAGLVGGLFAFEDIDLLKLGFVRNLIVDFPCTFFSSPITFSRDQLPLMALLKHFNTERGCQLLSQFSWDPLKPLIKKITDHLIEKFDPMLSELALSPPERRSFSTECLVSAMQVVRQVFKNQPSAVEKEFAQFWVASALRMVVPVDSDELTSSSKLSIVRTELLHFCLDLIGGIITSKDVFVLDLLLSENLIERLIFSTTKPQKGETGVSFYMALNISALLFKELKFDDMTKAQQARLAQAAAPLKALKAQVGNFELRLCPPSTPDMKPRVLSFHNLDEQDGLIPPRAGPAPPLKPLNAEYRSAPNATEKLKSTPLQDATANVQSQSTGSGTAASVENSASNQIEPRKTSEAISDLGVKDVSPLNNAIDTQAQVALNHPAFSAAVEQQQYPPQQGTSQVSVGYIDGNSTLSDLGSQPGSAQSPSTPPGLSEDPDAMEGVVATGSGEKTPEDEMPGIVASPSQDAAAAQSQEPLPTWNTSESIVPLFSLQYSKFSYGHSTTSSFSFGMPPMAQTSEHFAASRAEWNFAAPNQSVNDFDGSCDQNK